MFATNGTIAYKFVCLPCQVVTAGQLGHSKAGHKDETFPINTYNATGTLTTSREQMLEHFPYNCTSCDMVFVERRLLLQHIRATHEGTRYPCPQCQCTCVSKNGLNEHVKLVHEKFVRYRCETCGKGYSRRAHYHDHLATHTAVKLNICTVCRRQFTFRDSLKKHVRRFHLSEAT